MAPPASKDRSAAAVAPSAPSADPTIASAGEPAAARGGTTLAPAPVNYESALTELEGLVSRMEGGALNLEDSLAAYRRGAVLVSYCQQQLEKVDQQVRVLDGETLRAMEGVPRNDALANDALAND